MLVKFKRHTFNIRQQFTYCREQKKNLSENESIVHVDFSENYTCKYSSNIQSAYYGASNEQAILHTGILYAGPNVHPLGFSTITSSRMKGPPAIWEHLKPVLTFMKNLFPAIKVVHFLSDGPCLQYRQKANF